MPLTDFDGNVPPIPGGVGYTPPGFAEGYRPPAIGESVLPIRPPVDSGASSAVPKVSIPDGFWGYVMLMMGLR